MNSYKELKNRTKPNHVVNGRQLENRKSVITEISKISDVPFEENRQDLIYMDQEYLK